MAKQRDGSFKVGVVDYGRACFYLRYKDPITGKQVAKSSETRRTRKRR